MLPPEQLYLIVRSRGDIVISSAIFHIQTEQIVHNT